MFSYLQYSQQLINLNLSIYSIFSLSSNLLFYLSFFYLLWSIFYSPVFFWFFSVLSFFWVLLSFFFFFSLESQSKLILLLNTMSDFTQRALGLFHLALHHHYLIRDKSKFILSDDLEFPYLFLDFYTATRQLLLNLQFPVMFFLALRSFPLTLWIFPLCGHISYMNVLWK